MFKKPIKVKSNTQTKASERKVFKDLLIKTFPVLCEADVNSLISKKETINCLKIVTADNIILQIYTVQKRPICFELKGKIFPTVFLLWQFPQLVYTFTTHEQVMRYISSGADLMLPGVVTPPLNTNLPRYGTVSENDVVAVNLSSNRSVIAVGVASQSSKDMQLANGRGKCVNIYHFYGDNLCTLEGLPLPQLPNLGAPEWLTFNENDFPELGSNPHHCQIDNRNEEDCEILDEYKVDLDSQIRTEIDDSGEEESTEEMDKLLVHCFLGAIKYSKTLTLPALISNFFKLHMLPICPHNRNLDIKKTSFKKLKPFLEVMVSEGIITVKELKKGVEAITEINKNHPKFSEFYLDPNSRPKKDLKESENELKTDVVESYIITQAVVPIFEASGFKKGDTVQVIDVRKQITEYVKHHSLQDGTNSKLVKPNSALSVLCKTENPISWEEVMEKVCNSMKNCYKVKAGSEEIFNKGKVSAIVMSVSVRSGNKKVTLVDNLELFGINLPEFSKQCQHGVAASTSISRPPGKKSDQLLIQGNQILYVYNLLVEKYKIPKKYIKGLENAPKKKK